MPENKLNLPAMAEDAVQDDDDEMFHDEPDQNSFEKAKWNSQGYDQSGMK